MCNFNRTPDRVASIAGRIASGAIGLAALCILITGFWLYDGGAAFAHGEPEPEPAKPADAKAAVPEVLPPRPREYPRGLNEKPRPGEVVTPAKPAVDPKASESRPPDIRAPDGKSETKPEGEKAEGPSKTMQPMPAPVDGPGATGDATPDANEMAVKPVHWVPPKRYHFLMDTYTGLAMGGIDPVTFFVDGEPRRGSNDYELDWGGTTWNFVNEGNMLAFKQNPEVYAPKFGGRCAYGLSQGLTVEAQPRFFVIFHNRLYLFANAGYRAAFLTNPDALSAEAERLWPILARGEP